MNMMRHSTRLLAFFCAAASVSVLTPAGHAQTLSDALAASRWGLDFRHRIELVDEDGFSDNARASTLRTRLNLKTGSYEGLQAFIEFSDVREIGLDDFNAGAGATPDRNRFPVVADAEDTRVNQAWLGFKPGERLEIRAGRQRIKLDNDRFVGNVGWRQNEQTYDGASLEWNHDRWNVFYSYVGHVNRIFDSSVPAGDHDHDTHLVNASFDVADGHALTGYLYDIEDRDQQAFSSRTLGLRYTGSAGLLSWLTEYARQSDAGDNPTDYDADYLHLRADIALDPRFEPVAGFERLEGSRSAGEAFRTPLATLHAFNGWADRFLTTPDTGLEDIYGGFTGRNGRLGWNLTLHRFESEATGARFGDEIDASVSIDVAEKVALLLQVAHFDSSSAELAGATKFWAQLSLALP
ncbi:MAG: hypothetical protein CMP07_05120 [Xanthomonadales bacterium]|nr:hypothetical protein [Xanthomonadales bacterium]|tara:strand:+ start:425 stop:1648 length:1224 start_codon:yes stop_codon:yes gene_type:complete